MALNLTKTINPANIESELERIWNSLQTSNKIRACLFNLIIYTQRAQRNLHWIKKIIKKFPSRIMLITYDNSGQKHDLHTSVSVLSAGDTEVGGDAIACDLIEINLCNTHHRSLPFIIFPHILPDLPVYLVYLDDPSKKNPISHQLGLLANRIIFDSEVASNLSSFAKSVRKHKEECHVDIADLNWTRTEAWRQLFATTFNSPEDLSQLRTATKIAIYYNSKNSKNTRHTNIQPIYLQTWIAAQLDWQFTTLSKEVQIQHFFYDTTGMSTQISLYPSYLKNLTAGSIFAIEITTKSKYHYLFKRSEINPNHIVINRSNPNYCLLPLCYVLDKKTTERALIKEICHKGTSMHYTTVLHMLKKIKTELSRTDDE